MKARYSVPITRREAESFLKANIGNVRLPAGAKYMWVAGVHTVTDQAGVYLVGAAGGNCGVVVLGNTTCQIALMGHRHIRMYHDRIVTGVSSTGKMTTEHRAGMFVASYLDAWIKPASGKLPIDSYVDQIGAPPVPLGTTPIVIYPDEKQFDFIVGSGRTALELVPQKQMAQADSEAA